MVFVAARWLLLQLALLARQAASLSAFNGEAHRLKQYQGHESSDARDETQVKLATLHRHHQTNSTLKMKYSFYHTSDEIKSEITRLSKHCNDALNATTVRDGEVDIDVVTVRKPGVKAPNKVFILFGEHSRELISPESGLYFLRALCGEADHAASTAASLVRSEATADVLQDAEFQLVLNANPRSRRKVESGDYCLRTNPDGVDLNRNWDERWQSDSAAFDDSSNPGPKPFSEPETRIFKRLVTEYAPTTFLTVHSGTRGMYMPWAYDMKHLASYNGAAMMEILKALDKDHCQCPFGAAGAEVGYPCPGTCLDYAFAKLKAPFAYAFEIYTNPSSDQHLRARWKQKMEADGASLLQQYGLGHAHFQDVFSNHASDFIGAKLKSDSDNDIDGNECFEIFNPSTKESYEKVVKNWAHAYIRMSSLIAEKIRAGKVPVASSTIE